MLFRRSKWTKEFLEAVADLGRVPEPQLGEVPAPLCLFSECVFMQYVKGIGRRVRALAAAAGRPRGSEAGSWGSQERCLRAGVMPVRGGRAEAAAGAERARV